MTDVCSKGFPITSESRQKGKKRNGVGITAKSQLVVLVLIMPHSCIPRSITS